MPEPHWSCRSDHLTISGPDAGTCWEVDDPKDRTYKPSGFLMLRTSVWGWKQTTASMTISCTGSFWQKSTSFTVIFDNFLNKTSIVFKEMKPQLVINWNFCFLLSILFILVLVNLLWDWLKSLWEAEKIPLWLEVGEYCRLNSKIVDIKLQNFAPSKIQF